mmetsp:Transcript_9967/g.30681  ORF Transcript_9967/g.30681 Transcript_9967/m.30681 type:complete len:236 (-) Transcript_9967:371-1078(-)
MRGAYERVQLLQAPPTSGPSGARRGSSRRELRRGAREQTTPPGELSGAAHRCRRVLRATPVVVVVVVCPSSAVLRVVAGERVHRLAAVARVPLHSGQGFFRILATLSPLDRQPPPPPPPHRLRRCHLRRRERTRRWRARRPLLGGVQSLLQSLLRLPSEWRWNGSGTKQWKTAVSSIDIIYVSCFLFFFFFFFFVVFFFFCSVSGWRPTKPNTAESAPASRHGGENQSLALVLRC